MLALTGRLADGWLPSSGYAGPDQLAAMNKLIDEAAVDAGRDPASVRRLYNVSGRFAGSGGFLEGPEQLWIEQLTELTLGEGMSTYILASDDPDDIRRFAEVAVGVREAVDGCAGGGAVTPVEVVRSRRRRLRRRADSTAGCTTKRRTGAR